MGQISCSNCNCNHRENESNGEIKLSETLKSQEAVSADNATDISKNFAVESTNSIISINSHKDLNINTAIPKIVKLQAYWRGYQTRKMYSYLKSSKPNIKIFLADEKTEVRPPVTYKSGSIYVGE